MKVVLEISSDVELVIGRNLYPEDAGKLAGIILDNLSNSSRVQQETHDDLDGKLYRVAIPCYIGVKLVPEDVIKEAGHE
jgi:hypothetical protein